jgi:hypothetical protein
MRGKQGCPYRQLLELLAHQLEQDVKRPVRRSLHPGPEPPAQTVQLQMNSMAGAGTVLAAVATARAAMTKSFLSMFPPILVGAWGAPSGTASGSLTFAPDPG